jgi:hypothetical protein
VPSTLFWSSGIGKDGFNLTCIGVLFLTLNQIITQKFSLKKAVLAIVSILFLLADRGYEIVLMLPGLIALYLNFKKGKFKLITYFLCYLISIISFFIVEINLKFGYLNFVLMKQKLFVNEGLGHSSLRPLLLNSSWQSFFLTVPHALYRALFRPNIFQYGSSHELIYAVIHTLYLLMCAGLLFLFFKHRKPISSLAMFCIFYSICLMIFIGWIVPNVGAMVRYTSCAYAFFTLFFVLIVDESKIKFIKTIEQKFDL